MKKYSEMNESKKQANELIKSVNEIKKTSLDQLKIDDNDIITSNENIDQLRTQIEKEKKNMKNAMFDDQIMKFEATKASITEKILVKLIYKNIDFIIIFKFI